MSKGYQPKILALGVPLGKPPRSGTGVQSPGVACQECGRTGRVSPTGGSCTECGEQATCCSCDSTGWIDERDGGDYCGCRFGDLRQEMAADYDRVAKALREERRDCEMCHDAEQWAQLHRRAAVAEQLSAYRGHGAGAWLTFRVGLNIGTLTPSSSSTQAIHSSSGSVSV